MKTFNKTLLALLATSAVSVGANAALYNHSGVVGQPYVGVKVGQSKVDLNTNGLDNDDPVAYGIYGGYQFDPNWGVEAEYVGSDKEDLKAGGSKVGNVKQKTFGAYGTYKYTVPNTNLYAKGKLGIAQNKVKLDGSNYSSDDSKTGLAGGVGLGYNVTPMLAIEAEYDRLPSVSQSLTDHDTDTDLMTIGAHVKF